MRRMAAAAALALALGGCSALTGIGAGTQRLESYELQPLTREQPAARAGGPHLLVELPEATEALASDRIVIKPSPRALQYLPGARWAESADEYVQRLLVRSLSETGRFGLVTGQIVGPAPDFILLPDLYAFQAEVIEEGAAPARVRVSLALALMTGDGEVLASRRVERTAEAASTGAADLVAAFDAAMTELLREAVPWVAAAAG